MILWCVLFCFVLLGGGLGFVAVIIFHCFTLGNFGKLVDEKYNLVVFLSHTRQVDAAAFLLDQKGWVPANSLKLSHVASPKAPMQKQTLHPQISWLEQRLLQSTFTSCSLYP